VGVEERGVREVQLRDPDGQPLAFVAAGRLRPS